MLRKLTNSLVLNKNILRKLGNRFSSNSEPNKDNQQPQKTPDIDPPSVQPPQKPQKEEGKNIRSEARIFVCRSQLNKYAKAEVDYEKLNIPTKQLQKLQKILQQNGIKIRHIIDEGPLIEFYHSQQNIKKPQTNQEKSEKQQQGSQETVPQQEQDIKIEFKIFTKPYSQLTTAQMEQFEKYFALPEDVLSKFNDQFQKSSKGGNIFGPPKKRSGTLANSSFKEYKNIYSLMGDILRHGLNVMQWNKNQKKEDMNDYKEFSIYMRDTRKQSNKWAKIDLIVENWQAIHFYRIGVVDNAEQDAKKGKNQVNKYKGPQAQQLDKQLLELLKLYIQSVQEIDPRLFLPIYYYNGLKEQDHYRKWLDDMVDITK